MFLLTCRQDTKQNLTISSAVRLAQKCFCSHLQIALTKIFCLTQEGLRSVRGGGRLFQSSWRARQVLNKTLSFVYFFQPLLTKINVSPCKHSSLNVGHFLARIRGQIDLEYNLFLMASPPGENSYYPGPKSAKSVSSTTKRSTNSVSSSSNSGSEPRTSTSRATVVKPQIQGRQQQNQQQQRPEQQQQQFSAGQKHACLFQK